MRAAWLETHLPLAEPPDLRGTLHVVCGSHGRDLSGAVPIVKIAAWQGLTEVMVELMELI